MKNHDTVTIRRCVHCMSKIENDGTKACPHCGRNPDPASLEQQSYCMRPLTLLKGKYLVGKSLGHGGFGITYIGLDTLLDIKVAIKECFPNMMVSRNSTVSNTVSWTTGVSGADTVNQSCDNFLKEARKMAKIKDISGIVRVLETFNENNTAYIIMDYVDGITVTEKIENGGKMAPDECIEFFRPIMHALAEVHKLGFIHRDISPDNIMVDADGKLKLLDLGAAKDLNGNISGQNSTATSTIIRSGFSPIEQYASSGNIGPWTDVYAFAATMYYCMTQIRLDDSLGRFSNPEIDFNPRLFKKPPTETVKKALTKGLEVKYSERTQTMEEFEKSFGEVVPAARFAKNKPGSAQRQNPGSGKKPQIILAAAASALMIAAALGAGFAFGTANRQRESVSEIKPEVTTAPATEAEIATAAETTAAAETAAAAAQAATAATKATTVPTTTEPTTAATKPTTTEPTTAATKPTTTEPTTAATKPTTTEPTTAATKPTTTEPTTAATKPTTKAATNATTAEPPEPEKSPGPNFLKVEEKYNDKGQRISMFDEYKSVEQVTFRDTLEGAPDDAKDYSASGDKSVMVWKDYYGLIIAANGKVRGTDLSYLFCGFSRLQNIDLSGLDTSDVTNMSHMFYNCIPLRSSYANPIDFGGFNTSEVTNMSSMFENCQYVFWLDLRSFDTSKVTDMSRMFCACTSLDGVFGDFDMSNVTNKENMFLGCSASIMDRE